jgi:hypothetical protein
MPKESEIQQEKAKHKNLIRNWMLTGKPMPSGRERPDILVSFEQDTTLYYLKKGNREVQVISSDFVLAHLAMASSELAERSGGKEHLEMSKAQAKDCLFMIESRMGIEGCDLIADGGIVPIAFQDDPGYCILRLPVNRIEPTPEWLAEDIDYQCLGPFLDSLRINMTDYDGTDSLMFRRLLSAVGALLWGNEPRREILYWQGKGGEGKTTFCNFLAHKLGAAALPNVKPKSLTDNYTIAMLEGKRLVIAEEAGKGRFLTEEMKALTGNRYLTGRAPYKELRTFRNHSFIWMTSNEMPLIKEETAHTDRLRWIKSTPRKDGIKRTEQEIFDELEQYWQIIVALSVREYFAAGKAILPLSDNEIRELSGEYHLGTDGWIMERFEHREGAFVPKQTIKNMIASCGDKISANDVIERLHILQPAICDADLQIRETKRRVEKNGSPLHGVANIAIKESAGMHSQKFSYWTTKPY